MEVSTDSPWRQPLLLNQFIRLEDTPGRLAPGSADRLDLACERPLPLTTTDAAALAQELKPEVFCFCTLPNLRLEFIKMGVASGAKLIAFEKPVAMTSGEGLQIKQELDRKGTKTFAALKAGG